MSTFAFSLFAKGYGFSVLFAGNGFINCFIVAGQGNVVAEYRRGNPWAGKD